MKIILNTISIKLINQVAQSLAVRAITYRTLFPRGAILFCRYNNGTICNPNVDF